MMLKSIKLSKNNCLKINNQLWTSCNLCKMFQKVCYQTWNAMKHVLMMLLLKHKIQKKLLVWFSMKNNAAWNHQNLLTSHSANTALIQSMIKILYHALLTKKAKFNVLDRKRIIPSTLLLMIKLMSLLLNWNLIHTQSHWSAFSCSKLFSAQWFASGPIIK